jgi:hypothetical protein
LIIDVIALTAIRYFLNINAFLPVVEYRSTLMPMIVLFSVLMFSGRTENIANAYIVSVLCLLVIGIFHLIQYGDMYGSSILVNSIIYDSWIVISIPINFLYIVRYGKDQTKWFYFIAWINIILSIPTVIASTSRIAIATSIFLYIVCMFIVRKQLQRILLKSLIVSLCIFFSTVSLNGLFNSNIEIFIVKLFPNTVNNERQENFQNILDKSDADRIALMKMAIRKIGRDPFGIDGNSLFELPKTDPADFSSQAVFYTPHNTFLILSLLYGLQGSALWVIGFIAAIWIIVKRNRRIRIRNDLNSSIALVETGLLVLTVLAFLAFNIFHGSFCDQLSGIIICVCLGLFANTDINISGGVRRREN